MPGPATFANFATASTAPSRSRPASGSCQATCFPSTRPRRGSAGFVPLADVRDAAERRQIERALEETGGQIAKAAGLLAVSRTTLWEKMTRLGLADRVRSDS